jgi:hypothetical protein
MAEKVHPRNIAPTVLSGVGSTMAPMVDGM